MLSLKLVCIVRTVKANYKLEIVFTLLGGYCTIQPKISYFYANVYYVLKGYSECVVAFLYCC